MRSTVRAVGLFLPLFLASSTSAATGATAQDDTDRNDFDEARALLERNELDAATEAFRAIVEREPENASAWFYLGYALHVGGRVEEALEAHVIAAGFDPKCHAARYNAACANALLGRREEAFAWLGRAIAAGFANRSLLRTDPDLASLRDDPRFAALLAAPDEEPAPFRGDVRVLRVFDGEAAGDQFGWEGRNAGDADGDGLDDVLLSAPYKTLDGPNAGRIYVYSGATGRLLFERSGKAGELLGIGIEAAGDVDADGHADVIAGASGGQGGLGKAYVFSGRDGSTLLELGAGEPGDNFGWKVTGAGDVDGDGRGDVAVGAPGCDGIGRDSGRVYVFSGRDGSLLLELDGEEEGDGFGGSLAGYQDTEHHLLVVGAGNAGPRNQGRIYVFEVLESDVRPMFTIEADETGANLGRMFASVVGDVDADGFPDVYASDWENNAHGRNTGRIYVHSGRTGARLLTLTGERAGDGFGIGTAKTGDVTGDGHADLIIGAWQNGEGGASAGKSYLYSGKDGALVEQYVCTAAGDTFGFDAIGMGDLDGDGGTDFLITSAWSGVKGAKSGRAFVIAGPRPTKDTDGL